MDFILNEATENGHSFFSDNEEDGKRTDELDDFIDNKPQTEEYIGFYRQLDPENINNHPKFNSTTRNPIDAIYEDDVNFYCHEDRQPELYFLKDRESIYFDKFEGFKRHIVKFEKTLKNFEGSENQLLNAVIQGIIHYRCDGEQIVKEKIVEVLGGNLFNDLKKIEEEVKLDITLF